MSRFKRETNKASAILCADIHLRTTVPRCRKDEFQISMMSKWELIIKKARELDVPIIIAGDLGDKSQWHSSLEEWFITVSKGVQIVLVPGQHDLPNHRIDLWKKSSIGVLHAAEAIEVLGVDDVCVFDSSFAVYSFPYGTTIKSPDRTIAPNIAVAHMMVIEGKPLWPGQKAPMGKQLLKKHPEYDLILTGDNHNPFISTYAERWLINPGSMMRTTAIQADHEPRFYIWHSEVNTIDEVKLPILPGVVSREHIDGVQERDERIEVFVSHLKTGYEVGLDFEQNMDEFFKKNRTKKSIKEMAWTYIDGGA